MSVYNDAIGRMNPERAKQARDELVSELEFNCKRLVLIKNRRHKILKKLDKEIADIEEQISQLRNTVAEIDKQFFGVDDEFLDLI